MCGIVGYVGTKEAYPVVIKGLKRLEYRGYDSSGVALLNSGLKVYKKMGRVAKLETDVIGKNLHSHTGIGHTRWATHAEPSDRNPIIHKGDVIIAISQSGETVPMQFLTYYIGVSKGYDVDKLRNLAKSVTVE